MVTSLKSRVAAIAIVILVVCGCRSVSTISAGRAIRVPFGMGGSFAARPKEMPQKEYDDDPENQSLPSQSDAPGVLPAPGASEAEDTPPVPSAKKSRWNLVPSGLKFPSTTRLSEVLQTGIKSDRGASKTISKQETISKQDSPAVTEEVVGSRSSAASRKPTYPLSPSSPNRSNLSESSLHPSPLDAPADQNRSATTESSTASRYEIHRGLGNRTSPLLDPIARPLSNPNPAESPRYSSDEDSPVLLPPGN